VYSNVGKKIWTEERQGKEEGGEETRTFGDRGKMQKIEKENVTNKKTREENKSRNQKERG